MFSSKDFVIESVEFFDTGRVGFKFKDNTEYSSCKYKDFYRIRDWKTILKKGVKVRLWTIQASIVVGVQVFIYDKWVDMWTAVNDFDEETDE